MSFPVGSDGKESTCNAGDTGDVGLIPGLGRSPEEENGNPLQYSFLKNPMNIGVWWATLHRVSKNLTQLSRQREAFFPKSTWPHVAKLDEAQ